MRVPVELIEKTKALLPEAKNLFEAVEKSDVATVLDLLYRMSASVTNATNEWLLVSMKGTQVTGAAPVENPIRLPERLRRAA